MTTTATTITVKQIMDLEIEAGQAGDMEQVQLCRAALAGDSRARELCAEVFRAAEAMGDD